VNSVVLLTVLCLASIVGVAVWMVAYRVGFKEGRLTIPLRLIHALAEHKLACLGEHPDKVASELVRVLALPERESRRLIGSKLRSLAAAPPRHLRSA
jgi:hypothetical protein